MPAAPVIDLTFLTPLQGYVIQGAGPEEMFRAHVSSAGDVNGDGIDDLIIGAPYGQAGAPSLAMPMSSAARRAPLVG